MLCWCILSQGNVRTLWTQHLYGNTVSYCRWNGRILLVSWPYSLWNHFSFLLIKTHAWEEGKQRCKIFFLFLVKFYWSIVDLQCCDNFFCTPKWFSYPFPFRFFSHIDYHRLLDRALCAAQQVPVGQSFHRPQCAYANPKPPVNPSHPPKLVPFSNHNFFSLWVCFCFPNNLFVSPPFF